MRTTSRTIFKCSWEWIQLEMNKKRCARLNVTASFLVYDEFPTVIWSSAKSLA